MATDYNGLAAMFGTGAKYIGSRPRSYQEEQDAYRRQLEDEARQQENLVASEQADRARREKRRGELDALASFFSPDDTARRNEEQALKIEQLTAAPEVQGQTQRDVARITAAGNVGAAQARGSAAGTRPLASGLLERVAGGETSRDILRGLKGQYQDAYVGPAAGRFNSFLQQVPLIPADTGFARFKADSDTLTNATIKAITGAQMSEPEAVRIKGQIPSVTDKPEVWAQKAESLDRSIRGLNVRIALLQQGVPAQELDRVPVEQLADQYGFDDSQDQDEIADPNWGQ